MHPIALDEFLKLKASGQRPRLVRMIEGARNFHIAKPVHEFAMALANHEAQDGAAAPKSSSLPCDIMVMTIEDEDGEVATCILNRDDEAGGVCFGMLVDGAYHKIGAWAPGSPNFRSARSEKNYRSITWRMAFIISLINQPRKASRREVLPSRQVRRSMERTLGFTPAAYTEVCWTIGKATRAKAGGGDPKYRMPLHWCRGHWRSAEANDPKAVWLPEFGAWKKWVIDCWKGHPDYGTRLQAHIPMMPGEKRQVGASAPTLLSADRLAVMDAQKAAAISQAGFAA